MCHHRNRFTALFPCHPGEPVPEENFWITVQGKITTDHPARRHYPD